MSRFAGRVAIVTGGGEGIGRSIAARLAGEGARVGIIDLDETLGRSAADEIAGETGAVTSAAQADVSDEHAVERAVSTLVEVLGEPSVLVNNAGIFVFKGIEATPAEWRQSLDVNVMGPALVTKHVHSHMRAAGGGAIVNIGSVSGVIAQRGFLTYNASKGAVLEMTRCMALDLSPDHIRVNSVSPGGVWSASVERFAAEQGWSRAAAGQQPNLGLETMLGRPADPSEIAAAVAFLCSDDASYITGANLMVDAGWTAV